MTTFRGGIWHRLVSRRSGVPSFFLVLLGAREVCAYRTIEDLPDFPDGQRVRWSSAALEFQVHEVVPSWLSVGVLTATSQRAFDAWSETGCSSVRARYVGLSAAPAASGDGVNTIEVVTTGWEAFGYERDALGATELELEQNEDGGWQIIEADIRINAEHHEWSLSDAPPGEERSLLGTLRHEGGHALGLLHPCEPNGKDAAPVCDDDASVAETIMHPFYDSAQVELLVDDVEAVCYLYPTCEVDGCPEGLTCTPAGCLSSCGDTLCAADESCVEGRCISSDECKVEMCAAETPEGTHLCEQTDVCPHGLCLDDGSCAVPCVRDTDCQAGSSCLFGGDPNQTGYCSAAPLKQLGEQCDESRDCAQGECLAGARREPICTRLCGAFEPSCPSGWSCSGVDGRSVCIPPRAPRGCGVAAGPSRSGSAVHLLTLLAVIAGSVRFRRTSSLARKLPQAKS